MFSRLLREVKYKLGSRPYRDKYIAHVISTVNGSISYTQALSYVKWYVVSTVLPDTVWKFREYKCQNQKL